MTTKRARNLTANEPQRTVACGNCNKQVIHIQPVAISPTATQRVCDDCVETVRYSPPEPEISALCVDCYEVFTPHYADQKRCDGCRDYIKACIEFSFEWERWERDHIFIASPLAFRRDALTEALLNAPRPEPTPEPAKEADVPKWETLIDHVLDAGRVVSNLDFAVPVDLHAVVSEYMAPAPIIDIAPRIASKAAWSDAATTFAREQAARFADIYGPLNFQIAFTPRGFFNLEARTPEAIAA
jgi:hypothetical protein